MKQNEIVVEGAREHNLKNVNLSLPKQKLIVMTGPSGSGKSSMAFDTLFSEGRRRYLDSLSVYARQFIGEMRRPEIDDLRGIGPTIAIDQKTSGYNPRSTVGTITEIYDFMRVLWSNLGVIDDPKKGEVALSVSVEAAVLEVLSLPPGTKLMVLAPLVRNRKGMFKDLIEQMRQSGFSRLRIDGEVRDLFDDIKLLKSKRHTIDLIVDRIRIKESQSSRKRLTDSLELALSTSEEGGAVIELLATEDSRARVITVSKRGVSRHGPGAHGLSAQCFSYNSPLGMCKACHGLGQTREMDPSRVIPDPALSIDDGAVAPWAWRGNKLSVTPREELLAGVYEALAIDPSVPFKKLTKAQQTAFLRGTKATVWVKRGRRRYKTPFDGVLDNLLQRYEETISDALKDYLAQFIAVRTCKSCGGSRLNAAARAVKLDGHSIADVNAMSVRDAIPLFESLSFEGGRALIAVELVPEVVRRLQFLERVGLGYLQLSRSGPTLSGGESQRIRLSAQLGSGLTGVLYVLDEPSIGLHPRDHRRLLRTLEGLRDQGNTILVVEHDADTMRAADHLVDFGPAAGKHGGEIMYSGPGEGIEAATSLTADYLSGRKRLEIPATRRESKSAITIKGASEHNLRNLNVKIPLGVFTCVTGVSGAGKSTLVNSILYPAALNAAQRTQRSIGACKSIEGLEGLDRVIAIDQKPIGRTPRSNPGTYTKVFDLIRQRFAALPESKIYGYKPGRFSFNVKGGRCEACQGAGIQTLEMQFLSDVYLPCEVCSGRRFSDTTLRVKYRGHSIADVLEMTIEEAHELFEAYPKINRILKTLVDVGLGYIHLGQRSPTLSGGEAQRVKLSKELARPSMGHTLYVLDEPSTGLHFEDIRHLLIVIQRLVDAGNSVVIIEHNLDIIKSADHLIDLGPEGGDAGGKIVAKGTPEAVSRVTASHTGHSLLECFEAAREATG